MPLTSRKVVTQEEPAPQEAPQEAPSSSAQGSALKVKKQRTAKQLAADERSRQRMKERWAKIKAEQAAAGHPAEPKPDDKVPSQPVSEMPKSEPIDPEQVAAKRGRGRPASFPNQETKMAGYNLPVTTLDLVTKAAAKRGVNQNILVDRALRAYLRKG